MIEVRQRVPDLKVKNLAAEIKKQLKKAGLSERVQSGMKIALTAGSRGISCYSDILGIVVQEAKSAGGDPFIVPAMGSHGRATPEGQLGILRSLGITPETIGAPIRASMEVKEIGRLEGGLPIYVDKIASESDGIIVINRVKPHTDFKAPIESGLMKMMAIGLGKQKGAETVHRHQSKGYHEYIPSAARLIMKKTPVILGLAVVENANHEIALVKAFKPEEIERGEAKLLVKAKAFLARLPFEDIDILIVDEIGKNISGTGMDPNVVGRFWVPGEKAARVPRIKRIVVLDLSEETHGNAIGIGLADLTTKKVMDKIDFHATFLNCLTAGWPQIGKIPVFLPNDREAITTAIRVCGPIDPKKAKIVRIKNTLQLDRLWISESLYEMVQSDTMFDEQLEIVGKARRMQFDVLGMLAR